MNRVSDFTVLSEESQRIEVAIADGWSLVEEYRHAPDPVWSKEGEGMCHFDQLPDYMNDLNVIFEAVNRLSFDQKLKWNRHLLNVVRTWDRDVPTLFDDFVFASATAAQRSEAFVLTMDTSEDFDDE